MQVGAAFIRSKALTSLAGRLDCGVIQNTELDMRVTDRTNRVVNRKGARHGSLCVLDTGGGLLSRVCCLNKTDQLRVE